ncbi:hypothetical protein SAMN05444266_11648 [Chitinophaga jiangningensis]|uniref:HlyD family secretion protein n=1 Tax=Chitinophaga jiangningensis TaxID=1419482 RepID=A0A1M7N542_9BACT|nr:hypothetical protein [Chitinophaga jiangningensis]SHM98107.1 hypothetical protein SAMN05444266_11648 [Chitinophaga jiangningensis]
MAKFKRHHGNGSTLHASGEERSDGFALPNQDHIKGDPLHASGDEPVPGNRHHVNGSTLHASLEDIRSEPVQEIMGKMPPWLIRQGIVMLGVIILGLFAGAWFFTYPEVTPATVTIITHENLITATGKIAAGEAWHMKQGQEVLIRVTGFPSEQFGLLRGKVAGLRAEEADSLLTVDITLENGLVTTNGKRLPALVRLTGNGEITTATTSLLQRLLGSAIMGG